MRCMCLVGVCFQLLPLVRDIRLISPFTIPGKVLSFLVCALPQGAVAARGRIRGRPQRARLRPHPPQHWRRERMLTTTRATLPHGDSFRDQGLIACGHLI